MQREELRNISGEIVEEPKPKKRIKKVFITILILMLLVIGTVGGIALFAWNALTPPDASSEVVQFTVEPGMSSAQIADLLEDKGLIRNSNVFKMYLKYKGEGSGFQAGTYAMNPGTELDTIISRLNTGDVVTEELLKFTIPEGFTVQQIAESIEEQGYGSADQFLYWVQHPEAFGSKLEFIDFIPEDESLKYKLEGYLFPETYLFEPDITEAELVAKMLEGLDEKLKQLPEGWEQQLDNLGITFHDMMTIASLIEREVIVDEERPLVASVIYNRLNTDMMLQIDATIQYLLDKQKERLLYDDLEVDSPYNTYKSQGLPPGPIASPGIKSIEAALYPEQSTYFFYVTKKDGSGTHLFAETYEEHLQNKELSEQGQ
ncbi:endolytic transglycosylase MltG [Marinicrinis lubricantis]|uniref:Endolytic murein transglycosylase n=1 Tax=Marinicrinis lubricantis TaxID=2086470 RepID=A0ABW1IVQ5_9BACL